MHWVSVTRVGATETNTGRHRRCGDANALSRFPESPKVALASGWWTVHTKARLPALFSPRELYVVRLPRTEHQPPRERTSSATFPASRSLVEQNRALPQRSTQPSVSMRQRKTSRRASREAFR